LAVGNNEFEAVVLKF